MLTFNKWTEKKGSSNRNMPTFVQLSFLGLLPGLGRVGCFVPQPCTLPDHAVGTSELFWGARCACHSWHLGILCITWELQRQLGSCTTWTLGMACLLQARRQPGGPCNKLGFLNLVGRKPFLVLHESHITLGGWSLSSLSLLYDQSLYGLSCMCLSC